MQFHWYGFIVGLAIVAVYLITEKLVINHGLSEKVFTKATIWVFISSMIGARLWHVGTDFYLYQDHLVEILYLWQGGLSILGAILGGLIGLYFVARKYQFKQNILLDSLAFALPVGQFIGRWANFVNQELYGQPTNLPWKIFIKPENRLVGYEQVSYYQPLFLYEGLLALLGLILLLFLKRKLNWQLGQGKLFFFYLLYYLFVRFS